jgi:hypothetical protein
LKGKSGLLSTVVFLVILTLINKVFGQANSKTNKQIELLIKEKNLRSAIQKKIDSQLLQAVREKQGKKMTKGVDLQPASVSSDEKGNLPVDISADVTDQLLKKIANTGAVIIYPSKEYHTIKAEINLLMVEKIAAFPEVKFIAPASVPQLNVPLKPGTDAPITPPVRNKRSD